MHCVVKVENWKGDKVNGCTNFPPEFENGEQLNRLIATEDEIRLIAQEFEAFIKKCKDCNGEKFCTTTVEVALDEEVLVPETTVKVPITAEVELRRILGHIKDVCIDQVKNFLDEEKVDKPMSIESYKLPAFFNGNILSTVSH